MNKARGKLKAWHWAVIAVLLTAAWLGMMVWLSYASLRDKDPVRIEEWQRREQPPRP